MMKTYVKLLGVVGVALFMIISPSYGQFFNRPGVLLDGQKSKGLTANVEDNKLVSLYWRQFKDEETSSYVVQRSFDGTTYQDLVSVRSSNEELDPQPYTFIDYIEKPENNEIYYRLKQLSATGGEVFSESLKVTINLLSTVNYSPYTPESSQEIKMNFESYHSTNLLVTIEDLEGNTLFKDRYRVEKGSNELVIPNIYLHKGLYIINTKAGGESFYNRIIVD